MGGGNSYESLKYRLNYYIFKKGINKYYVESKKNNK